MTSPRITFGMIVLNGEPFVRYALRALYPFSHEIIVVEGAAPAARGVAREDGHSSDGTLETLKDFQANEDPERKVFVVTAEDEGHPNGFWPGEKDEQSRAYAARASGTYLWQVDSDEFYTERAMRIVVDTLRERPAVDTMSFHQLTFWAHPRYTVDGWYLRRGAAEYHRLFRWGPGYSYVTHRPPTVLDESGQNLRDGVWLDSGHTSRLGVTLFHYSLLFPKQVREKCDYYANASWAQRSGATEWAESTFARLDRPYRVHNVYDHPSWLERYDGDHPAAVTEMMRDVSSLGIETRDTADIERLLASRRYRMGRAALKRLDPVERLARRAARGAKRLVPGT